MNLFFMIEIGGVELKPLYLAAIIAAPFIISGIVLLIVVLIGRSKEDASDIKEVKKSKPEKKETKPKKRLQLLKQLLDIDAIAREGSLETDFCFKCIQGANKGEQLAIKKYVSTIGRRSTDGRINDIEISSFDKKVSRSQGKLIFRPEDKTFYIVNESDVSIRVNGDRVINAYPLQQGDKIELGGNTVVLLFTTRTDFTKLDDI